MILYVLVFVAINNGKMIIANEPSQFKSKEVCEKLLNDIKNQDNYKKANKVSHMGLACIEVRK
jgi:hypothetical protein